MAPLKPARSVARVEEIALTPNDFRPVAGGPALVRGVPAGHVHAGHTAIRVSEPGALSWQLNAPSQGWGDAIEAELELGPGDRVISLETDIAIEFGYTMLDLVEHSPAGRVTLLHLDGQNASSSRPFPVRRTIGPDARAVLRIQAELGGEPRRVFGCYLRVVRAA